MVSWVSLKNSMQEAIDKILHELIIGETGDVNM